MRLVEWTDGEGFKHLSWLKDNDPDHRASEGLSHDPPDVNLLDWHSIKQELHNRLVEMRLTDWSKVQEKQNAITGILQGIIKRHLIALYRSSEK